MNFIGSKYQGQKTTDLKRFHGLGQYTFPNGDRYVGGFYDGCFHGYGVIFYRKREEPSSALNSPVIPPLSRGGSKGGGSELPSTTGAGNGLIGADGVEEDEVVDDLHAFLTRGYAQERAGAPPMIPTLLPPDWDEEDEDLIQWQGQYRGLWEHGKNVSGCYVFADGLVYGGRAMKNDSKEEADAAQAACADWPYCQCSDHRLWAEHLRNITPVLPYETVFGGVAVQEAYRDAVDLEELHKRAKEVGSQQKSHFFWAEMPILVPSSCEQEMIPSSFAGGQPRGGKDVTAKWWKSAKERQAVTTALALPTDPLVAEEDPDHYVVENPTDEAEGTGQVGRRVENPNLQIRFPLHVADGSRSLTPCVPRSGAPQVYCTGIRAHAPAGEDLMMVTPHPPLGTPPRDGGTHHQRRFGGGDVDSDNPIFMPDAIVDIEEDGSLSCIL